MSRLRTPTAFAAVLAAASLGAACEERFTNEGTPEPDASDGPPKLFTGLGVGETCASDEECRDGLGCAAGLCTPTASKAESEKCLLTDECGDGLHCGWAGFCVPSGDGAVAAQCVSSADCQRGLFCDIQGVGGFCGEPNDQGGDLGAPCEENADCLAGLNCSAAKGECAPGSILLSPDVFTGVACEENEEAAMPFGVRHAVPHPALDAAKAPSQRYGRFYSLPFPNDIRITEDDVKIDLSDHPRTGEGIIGLDMMGSILDALETETNRWSIVPAVYFRFTRPIDADPTTHVPPGIVQYGQGENPNLYFVNLDANLDDRELEPAHMPVLTRFYPAGNKYICSNYLIVRPRLSTPLEENTTYGVFLLKGVKSLPKDLESPAEDPEQLDDLPALLSDEPALEDAEVNLAWHRYKKARKWLELFGIPKEDVIAMTSFTTGNPTRIMQRLRETAHAADPPKIVDGTVHVCGVDTGPSPCATPGFADTAAGKAGGLDPRECSSAATYTDHTEIHAKVRIPFVQEGFRPYFEGGGSLVLDAEGVPTVQGYEEVCVGFSIPKAPMPAKGFPVVIHGHGTGGSFRSGASSFGKDLATLKLDGAGATLPIAVVGFDGPMHGTRQGPFSVDPGPLFYNFVNPAAAKGNWYQAVVDDFVIVRLVKGFKGPLKGIAVQFDPARIAYHGHSQGGGSGPLFGPQEPDLSLMALSGTGGSAVHGLLGKKKPFDISVGIQIGLQALTLDEDHPAVNMIQFYYDEVDPLLYGRDLDGPSSGKALHLLDVYGMNDAFSPPAALRIYAAASNATLSVPDPLPTWFDKIEDLVIQLSDPNSKIRANREVLGQKHTRVVIEALNDAANSITGAPYDGHFVMFNDKDVRRRYQKFLATWLTDPEGIPTVDP